MWKHASALLVSTAYEPGSLYKTDQPNSYTIDTFARQTMPSVVL